MHHVRKIYENDGMILLMGIGLESATIIHYAEEVAEIKPFIRWTKGISENTVSVNAGSFSERFGNFMKILLPHIKSIQVGKSR